MRQEKEKECTCLHRRRNALVSPPTQWRCSAIKHCILPGEEGFVGPTDVEVK